MAIITITVNTNAAATQAFIRWLTQQYTGITAPLLNAVNETALTLNLNIGSWQPAVPGVVSVDSEIMRTTVKANGDVTVTRGFAGTTPAAHAAGAMVRDLKYSTFEEGAKAILIREIRAFMFSDQTLLQPVQDAETARQATIAAAVT